MAGIKLPLMNRLHIWAAIAVLLGAVVAVIDLFTGWTVGGNWASSIVVLGLLGGSFALYAAMLIGVISDRRRITTPPSDARSVLAHAARGVRWTSLFAVGFSVLLFANCSGGVGSSAPVAPVSGPPPSLNEPLVGSPASLISGPVTDPAHFWSLTVWVLAPLLLALLLPTVLTFAAERLAAGRPRAARRLGFLALWSMAAIVAAAFATLLIGFFVGFNACLGGGPPEASAGYCSAGVGAFMNPLSIGTLALFLPYLLLVPVALAQIEANQAR